MKICWFSTGVSSFIACYLAKDIDRIIYTHIDNQHSDSLRFLHDCEKFLCRKIEVINNDLDVDDVILRARYINSPHGAACTKTLKRDVRKRWEIKNLWSKGLFERHTYIWGYDVEEKHRAERVVEKMTEFDHEFPLIDAGLTKRECHDICNRLGLKRPAMYELGYPNNNCIGCVKGGMGYWNKIRIDFPDVFARRSEQERMIGNSCINGIFLDELDFDRGNMQIEVFEECGIACYYTLAKIESNKNSIP